MTCHRPHNVFDVVPADVVGSVILATAAAMVQVTAVTRLSVTCSVSPLQWPRVPLLCCRELAADAGGRGCARRRRGTGGCR